MKRIPLVFLSILALICTAAGPLVTAAPQTGDTVAADGVTSDTGAPGSVDPNGWPRKIVSGDTTIMFYYPQIDKWEGDRIQAYAAVSVETAGSQQQTYGTVYFTAHTSVDKANRTVTLDNFKVTRGNFPTASNKTAKFLAIIQQAELGKTQVLPQDQFMSDVAIGQQEHKSGYELRNDPPRIIFSSKPAVLVLIDGQPVLRSAGEGNLQRVINTHALVLFDRSSGSYYLSLMDGWAQAPAPEGPWTYAARVPPAADRIKDKLGRTGQVDLMSETQKTESGQGDPNASAGAPPQKPETLRDRQNEGAFPTIYVSTVPAELLIADGEPQFKPVPGTGLLYVENSGDQIFINTADQDYYVLVSGRWFISKSMEGPWRYVDGNNLPADFAKIPQGDPKASVLASTPGTPQAEEAAIANQIPQTAAVNRQEAQLTVNYDGEPQFQRIQGTRLQYAVNTNTPVIEVSQNHFCAVENGVWFQSNSPTGPWQVATDVPSEVYSIPPSCPIHYATYVRIYDYTPDNVYVGYTPGYYGTLQSDDGLVVYGSGFYYPPYIGSAWYGWPWTYGLGAGFGWSPFGGWGFGLGYGSLFPFVRPWWGPLGFGFGWPRYALGWGWGWRAFAPGFGFRAFGPAWGPGFGFRGWGGIGAFSVFGRWGGAAFLGARPFWAGRFGGRPGFFGAGFRGPGTFANRGFATGGNRGFQNRGAFAARGAQTGARAGAPAPRSGAFGTAARSGAGTTGSRSTGTLGASRGSTSGSPSRGASASSTRSTGGFGSRGTSGGGTSGGFGSRSGGGSPAVAGSRGTGGLGSTSRSGGYSTSSRSGGYSSGGSRSSASSGRSGGYSSARSSGGGGGGRSGGGGHGGGGGGGHHR
jgi:hypothetical protein